MLIGTDGPETLWGTEARDVVFGLAGDDGIIGDNGNDRLFGAEGHDIMDGGDGWDRINGGGGIDIVQDFAGGGILHGDADNDTLFGGGAQPGQTLDFYGDAGDDQFYVGTWAPGQITLHGGTGADTFYVNGDDLDGSAGRVVIADFHREQGDKIDLSMNDGFVSLPTSILAPGHDTNGDLRIDTQDGFTTADRATHGIALHTWDDTLVVAHTQALQLSDFVL